MSSFEHPIYLDYQTTAPLDPVVRSAMGRYLDWDCGDPRSEHTLGRSAAYALDLARTRVASLLGAEDGSRLHFTSSQGESLNLALIHSARYLSGERDHIVMSTLDAYLGSRWNGREPGGFDVTTIPPDGTGRSDIRSIVEAITERSFILVVSLAHGDTGTLQNIEELSRVARERGLLICVDASRGVGYVPLRVADLGIDLVILESHRLCGPRSVAALYVSRALVDGDWGEGALESSLSTSDVAKIVGFGVAADIARRLGHDEAIRIQKLGERLLRGLREANIPFTAFGDPSSRVPGYLALYLPDLDDRALEYLRQRVALSSRSCYSAGGHDASPVLAAMGIPDSHHERTVYIGIGRFTRETDIDAAVSYIVTAASETARRHGAPVQDVSVVVNCEGRSFTTSGTGYTQFCALSNTAHFLRDLGTYALEPIYQLGRPERISVVIPSYGSGPGIGATIASLLAQEVPLITELLVLINEPPDATRSIRAANDATETWLRSLISDDVEVPASFSGCDRDVRAALARARGSIRLHVVRHILDGGIPTVYQTVMSSFIRRARAYIDGLGGSRERRLRELDEIYDRTLLLFCDDDIEIIEPDALERAYYDAVVRDGIVLGRWRDLHGPPDDASPVERCALRLMECFLAIKYDLGVNALPPKGLLLRHVLEGGAVTLNDGFGDQLYFAHLASSHVHHSMDVKTSIAEADYASNGRMLRDLRVFLDGADNRAMGIFHNLMNIAIDGDHRGHHTIAEMTALIAAIESRNLAAIDQLLDSFEGGKGVLS